VASTKEYKEFVLEQLSILDDIDNQDTLKEIVIDTYNGLKE